MRYYILALFLSNVIGYSTYRLLNVDSILSTNVTSIQEAGVVSFINSIDPAYQLVIYIFAMISSILLLIHKTILHFRNSNVGI